MNGVSELLAVGRYEFRMQARKRSLWVAMLLLAAVIALTQGDRGPRYTQAGAPAGEVMAGWALLFGIVVPIGFGMVLADRLVRDRRLGTAALLESLPVGPRVLLAGKYLGGLAATALPALLVMLVAGGYESLHRGDPLMLGWAVLAFGLIMLPGLAFVAGFALVSPLVISAPLFRVLFVGYWFWGNMLPPAFLPSLSGTLLSPIGDYPVTWLTGETALYAGVPGWLSFLRPEPNGVSVLLSVVLLVLVGLMPLVLAGTVFSRQRRTA
ncbi:ABC transporter permease [Plantactinospora solaniradicis]|uniref:ABC transporter permease n=1 Tax=Plantactinospora solaniradicis TaxID=1723736 RepID=A0ABW1K5S4_9ACTN